jgi:hypothetical protein
MTLELSKITAQMDHVSRELAERAEKRQQQLPHLRALRQRFAEDVQRLRDLAGSHDGRAIRCAWPTTEPLDETFPAPEPPSQATILAADGSQIPPDPHGIAQYYLINVGSLIYRHGSGQPPVASSEPLVAPAADAKGHLLSADLLGARRDVAELQRLAELAESESGDGPTMALLDSTIGLRAWSASIPQAEQEALHKRYRSQLDRLWSAGAALVGFLSRSRQGGVVNLLGLAQEAENGAPSGGSAFPGITDQALWGDLQPGERSALFVQQGTLPVYFFYLNCDPPDERQPFGLEAEPSRIEVAEWVGRSPETVAWVHALVYDQCRMNDGYPYALTRADELAIIYKEEREALEVMLLQALSRQGRPLPRPSPKERQKGRARPRSRGRQ